jgi:hypothetical protein
MNREGIEVKQSTQPFNSHCELSNVIDMTAVACCNLFPMSHHHPDSGVFETLEVHELPQMAQHSINSHHGNQNTPCHEMESGPETNEISLLNGTRDILHPGTVVNVAHSNSHNDIDSRNVQTLITLVQKEESENDPHSPLQVDKKVKMVIHKWGPVAPINPERFFLKMLLSRGYSSSMIPALTSQHRR